VRLLLDTNALLWWLDSPKLLRSEAHGAIEEPANEIFVSAIAVWEIVLKSGLSKLPMPADFRVHLERARFSALPLTWEHSLEAGGLPFHHRDPFDRLLIAQARIEGLTIVTSDPAFEKYQVATIPA
jgi:PIN domain nuclease of toxin-antitoxin system